MHTMDPSVQFSRSGVSVSLRPHESQHTRPPCPSPTPRVYSDSCPSSQWCHPAISPSVVPFSSCPQSLPASGSFPVSHLFDEVAKVLEFQLQHQCFQWTPRTDLLQDGLVGSPCSPRDSQESSPHGKEMQKGKMVVLGGLTNSCEMKRSEKQRKKGKIFPFECRVPKNSQER